MAQTRKQELQEELNKIRALEIEKDLKVAEGVESSATAIQRIEASKAKAELEISMAKADADLKVETAKSDNYQKKLESFSHRFVTMGDFMLKFCIASAISCAFMYIVYAGSQAPVVKASELIGASTTKDNGLFQLLSVVGPLFGMVLSYYFGKSKSSINGE